MSNAFCDLPQELQIQILSNLDAVSLIRCAKTCTSIYETLQGSSMLEYTIELHRDGLKDAGTSLSYPDLIAFLRRRRQAWLSCEIKEPLIHHTQHNYDAFELVGSAYADISKVHYEILWLPTASNVQAHAIRRPSIGISPVNITMDPTQDLMVILEEDVNPQCVHIRSISTNTVHPQAQQSPLRWTNIPRTHTDMLSINRVVLQIAYNILAVLFPNARREMQVMVWDWTTSDLILDTSISSDPTLLASIYDFRLLDSTHFLVTCRSDCGSIRLYRLVRSTAQATHLVTLHLPPTAPGVAVHGMRNEAGPIEANPLPDAPFSIHDDDRLHLFTVTYDHEVAGHHARESRFLHLFLHQRLLLKYARQALTSHPPLEIPWAEWGPPDTRFSYAPHQYICLGWRRYIHGQRAILPEGEMRGRFHAAKIVDFSRAAVSCAKGTVRDAPPSSSSSASSSEHALLLSSAIRTEDVPVFLDDVETCLPCVTSRLALKRTYETYVIYADGFVGANLNYVDNNRLLNIYPI